MTCPNATAAASALSSAKEAVRAALARRDVDAAKDLLLAETCQVKCPETWTSVVRALRDDAKAPAPQAARPRGECVMRVFSTMTRRGVHRSPLVYSLVLGVLVASDDAKHTRDAVHVFRENFATTKHNAMAWSALFTAYGKLHHLPELGRAYEWLKRADRMEVRCEVDGPLVASVVTAFSRGRDIPQALEAFREQRRMGLPYTGAEVTSLLNASLDTGNKAIAKEVFQAAKDAATATAKSGQASVTLEKLLPHAVRVICRDGPSAVAFAAEHRGRLPAGSYTGLMHVCVDARDLPSAMQLLRMIPDGSAPPIVHTLAMQLAADAGTFDDVERVFTSIPEGQTDKALWNMFINFHCAARRPGVLRWIDRMDAEGVPRDHKELKVAIRNSEVCEEFEDAATLLRRADAEGITIRATLF